MSDLTKELCGGWSTDFDPACSGHQELDFYAEDGVRQFRLVTFFKNGKPIVAYYGRASQWDRRDLPWIGLPPEQTKIIAEALITFPGQWV